MQLKINGTDFTSFIAAGGFKWQRNDLESPKAGRTLDGTMQRGRVTTKIRLDITCRPLSTSELDLLMNKIYPEYVTVQYDDPMYGNVTKTMYSNNTPATCLIVHKDAGNNTWETWDEVTFPLIER
jgi:hypothetical protein